MRSVPQLDEPSPQTRVGWVVTAVGALLYVGLLAWSLPMSDVALAAVPAVPLGHALAVLIIAGLTAFVLWLAAVRSRRRGYLVLGGTFASIAVFMAGYVLSFPAGFRTSGPDGEPLPILGGESTALAFSLAMHVALTVGATAAAVVLDEDVRSGRRADLARIWPWILLGVLPAMALSLWWLLVPDSLPFLIEDGTYSETGLRLLQVSMALAIVGLAVTAVVTRGRSVMARWLIAVGLINIGIIWLNLDGVRYSVGWYVARGMGVLAFSLLLLALVWELSRADQRMQVLATRDTLTGTRARVTFAADAAREIARADRDDRAVGLMWIDLDAFKQVNDRFGHSAGDVLLVEVGRRIMGEVRDADLVARMGGDEFAVLLVALDGVGPAVSAAERIVASLRRPVRVGEVEVSARASVGIALYPTTAGGTEELVRQADVAMYAAKAAGGDRWAVYDPSQDLGYTTEARLHRGLGEALGGGELDLDAQPIVSTRDGEVQGVELLLRWQHDGSRVSAGPLVAESERTGRTAEIAHVVLDHLEQTIPALLSGPGLDVISINLCLAELLSPSVVGRLASPPLSEVASRIVLELSESTTVADDAAAAVDGLVPLRALGYRLAVDNVGVGPTHLARLQELHPDIIKIDRGVLARASAGLDPDAGLLTWATSMGRALGALTVVEGVETEAEAELARRVGADLAQGYWYGRPSPLDLWPDRPDEDGPPPGTT